jgi:hypothetical protein
LIQLLREFSLDFGIVDHIVVDGLYNRVADNWEPLLAIADAAGGDWPEDARAIAVAGVDVEDETDSQRTLLLADIRALFVSEGLTGRDDHLTSKAIVEALGKLEDRPWVEWKRGKPLTQRQLSVLLKPFEIKPQQLWTEDKNERGYRLQQFEDAFARYLPDTPLRSARPLGTQEDLGTEPDFDPLESLAPSGSKIHENPKVSAGSSGLADRNPLPPEKLSPTVRFVYTPRTAEHYLALAGRPGYEETETAA